MRRIFALVALVLTVSALGLTGIGSAAPADASAASLTGAKEVPGPGDSNGFGVAVASPRPAQGTVCINIRYRGIDAPTAAHIHEGPPTVAGPVVIDFGVLIATSPVGQITGCVPVEPALAADVGQNPSDYYVNVHNAAFPGGAIRGQLRG